MASLNICAAIGNTRLRCSCAERRLYSLDLRYCSLPKFAHVVTLPTVVFTSNIPPVGVFAKKKEQYTKRTAEYSLSAFAELVERF